MKDDTAVSTECSAAAARAVGDAARVGGDHVLGVRGAERQPAGRPARAVRDGRGRSGAPRRWARSTPAIGRRRWPSRCMAGWSVLLVLSVALLDADAAAPGGKRHFDMLTDFAMFGAVIFETMAVMTIFVLRRKMPPTRARPYRCWGYPVVPALYMVLPACLLVNYFVNQQAEAVGGSVIIAAGLAVYYLLA